jgi:hypothetical protein
LKTLQQPSKEAFGGVGIPPKLNKDVEHDTVLIHGSPKIVLHAPADGGELLLIVRGGMGLLARLYIEGDVIGPDRSEGAAALFGPAQEYSAGARIGPAGVRVADVGREEVDGAPRGVERGGLGGRRGRRKHGGQLFGGRCVVGLFRFHGGAIAPQVIMGSLIAGIGSMGFSRIPR